MGADWAKVHRGSLLSGNINAMYTVIPGPGGKFGYGGKCIPKEVNAFAKLIAGQSLDRLLARSTNSTFASAGLKSAFKPRMVAK